MKTLFSQIDSVDRNIDKFADSVLLEKLQTKFIRNFDKIGMPKYFFVLNAKESNEIETIQKAFVVIYDMINGIAFSGETMEDLLPLKELSSIVKSLEKQLYLINPTLNNNP